MSEGGGEGRGGGGGGKRALTNKCQLHSFG